VDYSFLTKGRIFEVNKKHGNSALDTDVDVAYSEKGELGNNKNKNKIKKQDTRGTYKNNKIKCNSG
jgi:hypothetical protein